MSTQTRFASLVSCLFLLLPLLAHAGEADDLRKKILFDEKKLVVLENMDFTAEESAAFWPVFERYQEDLFRLNQRAARLILAYSQAFQTLTDDQAVKIIGEYLDIEKERLALKDKYNRELSEVLPGKKAFRYMQVENKLEAISRFELAKEIPLAR